LYWVGVGSTPLSELASPPAPISPAVATNDLLLRASILTQGRVLRERTEIWRSLVLAGLSTRSLGDRFTVSDLTDSIQKLSRCALTEEVVVATLDRLVSDGALRHVEGLSYSIARPVALPSFSDLTHGAWKDFLKYLDSTKIDFDPYLDSGVQPAFDEVILKLLSKFASTLTAEASPFDLLPIDDFKAVIERILKKSTVGEKRQAPIATALSDFLRTGSPSLKRLVFDCYTGLIRIDIIRREQELPAPDFIDSLRFFLVDTSLIVTLLCKSDPAHPLALAVVRESRRRGLPLYFAAETRAELNGLITGTRRLAGSLTLPGHSGVLGNQFIADFQKSGMDWPEYFARLSMWETTALGDWAIAPAPADIVSEIDESIYSFVSQMLPIMDSLRNDEREQNAPDRMPRHRAGQQFDHDSFCLSMLAHQRILLSKQSGRVAMGPWLVTFDRLVTALNPYFQKELGLELVMQPRVALNYFLVYSKVAFNEADRDEVAEAILRYTARTPEPRLSLTEYLRLLTYRLGLEKSDVEVVRTVFLRHPLTEELEKALARGRADIADEMAYKVITNEPFVETVVRERKTQEKLHQAGKTATAERERFLAERSAREALERVINKPVTISVTVNNQVTVNLKAQIENVAAILDSEGAFSLPDFPAAEDLSTAPAVKGWLVRVKDWIELHPELSGGIKATLPLIGHLIGKLVVV
jgi:hypothetical protein